jgi:hypothetical protein
MIQLQWSARSRHLNFQNAKDISCHQCSGVEAAEAGAPLPDALWLISNRKS